jgi:aspartyl-tRNA(Asn)/glutamyl-tRNA(Gln) amidotransferase subunit C
MRIDVRYVSRLARLELTEEQAAKFQRQFEGILEYVEKLKTLDTKDILPLSHAVFLENVFREDKIKPSLKIENTLANAPQKESGFFKVPKIIK